MTVFRENENNISEDSQEMPQSRNTTFPGHQKKETLRKHAYSNILKILPPKNENFQIKFFYIFIFLLKT